MPAQGQLWSKASGCSKLDGPAAVRFRHPAGTDSVASAGRRRRSGRARLLLHRAPPNVLLAMDNDSSDRHQAHEFAMVAAALANDDTELRWAPYRLLPPPKNQWRHHLWRPNLLIALPVHAFGTQTFLRDAPDCVADWTGFSPRHAPRSRRREPHQCGAEGPRSPREL